MEPTETAAPDPGSIAGVAARLALWGRRTPQGLARVEFDSDYSRQEVDAKVRAACVAADIPWFHLELPQFTPAAQIVTWLKEQFAPLPHGVVSLTGWATAFPPDVPLLDSLRVLNYNRENLAQFPLCQIWWLTRPLAGTFLREIPDLNSWFIVRLSLDESIVHRKAQFTFSDDSSVSLEAKEAAQRQAVDLMSRFYKAIQNNDNIFGLTMLARASVIALYNAGLKQLAVDHAAVLLNEIIAVLTPQPPHDPSDKTVFNRPDAWMPFLWPFGFQIPTILDNIAFLFAYSGRKGEAEQFYRPALDFAAKDHGSNPAQAYAILEGLANSLRSQERYEDAARLFERFITLMNKETVLDRLILADRLYDLAEIYWLQEKFAEAEATFQRVLTIQEKESTATVGSLPWLLHELSKFYNSLGRFTEADMYERRGNVVLAKQSGLILQKSAINREQ